jgi:signal peptidase I
MTLALYLFLLISLSVLTTSFRFARNSPYAPKWLTNRKESKWGETIQIAGLFATSSFFIITLAIQVMFIPSASMEPGLKTGDKILVNPASFGIVNPFTGDHITDGNFEDLKRGDVVIAKFAYSNDVRYIKRLVGLPGDQLSISEDGIMLNDTLYPFIKTDKSEIYKVNMDRNSFHVKIASFEKFEEQQEVTIPSGHVFLLGDNLNKSSDSRDLGFIPLASIIARPF